MVSIEAGSSGVQAGGYLEIIENANGLTGWLGAIDPSNREAILIEFFRAIMAGDSVPKDKIFGFVGEALEFLQLVRDYPVFVSVGLEVRRIAYDRFGESDKSLNRIEKLVGEVGAAEPSRALMESLDSVLPVVEEMKDHLASAADVAGVDSGVVGGIGSIDELDKVCIGKLIERSESPEVKAADERFYSAIKEGKSLDSLAKALKQKRETDISDDMIAFGEKIGKAQSAQKRAMDALCGILVPISGKAQSKKNAAAVIAALRYLCTKRKVPKYVLEPVAQMVIMGETERAQGASGDEEIFKMMLLAIGDGGEVSIHLAAFLADKLHPHALARNS